jgi:hypothetical protein
MFDSDKPCLDHQVAYTGSVPCTGVLRCSLCLSCWDEDGKYLKPTGHTMQDVYDLQYEISDAIESLRCVSIHTAAEFDGSIDEITGTADEQYAASAALLRSVEVARSRFTA